ncbi:MAG: hypothetical protein J6T45_02100 [Fibrobacterales bacterium]|nr:hypothetical protein [Fibrobacterales bacterium]
MKTGLSRLAPAVALLATGCVFLCRGPDPEAPSPLAGRSVRLLFAAEGSESPALRAGTLLWGEATLRSRKGLFHGENFAQRARDLRGTLVAELARAGCSALPEDSPAGAGEAPPEIRLEVLLALGEEEGYADGFDRKGRKVSLFRLLRCVAAEGAGEVRIGEARVPFSPNALHCDTLTAETRADAFARAGWDELVDKASERFARVWVRRIGRAAADAETEAGTRNAPGGEP